MGLYLRKSLSVGPFRFNLSKSGIGLSTGIKDSVSELGHEETMSIWAAAEFTSARRCPARRSPKAAELLRVREERSSSIEFHEIESGSVSHMVDSSSAELLEEINSKSKKPLIWPWLLGLSICLLVACCGELADLGLLCAKYTKLTGISPRPWREAVSDHIMRFYSKK